MMRRSLGSLLIALGAVLLFTARVQADSGVVTDARAGLQDAHGWISAADAIKKYGSVRGYTVVFTYQFASDPPFQGAQPYDFHQVRYSINGSPERQVDRVDAYRFNCCSAQPGAHYVFKVQGCRSGTFGSDCTAWFTRTFDAPPDPTPRPRPTAPPPAPLPNTPQPTPRHIRLPHLPTPTPTPVPPFALNAPQVVISAYTRLQCGRISDPTARGACLANIRAGKMQVTWTWQRTPCNAVTCYAADAYVISAGGTRVTVDASTRSAWVARPDDENACIDVSALHNAPTRVATGNACVPSPPSKGKPQ